MADGVWKGVNPEIFGRSKQLLLNKFYDPSTPSIRWVIILGFVGDHQRVCGPRGMGRGPRGLGMGCTHVFSSRLRIGVDFTSVHFLLVGDHPWVDGGPY